MIKLFAYYPELLLLDATYKLNNSRMPLYVLMCVDGNGEGVIVALWIVANEEKVTIEELTNIFKKHDDTSGVQVVVTDKDMVERDVISEKIPNASLQLCLFHTLCTFRREITVEKVGIKAEQRLLVLEILQQLVYSDNEVAYDMHYDDLKALKFEPVIDYFNVNWHCIRMQWVEGLKKKKLNLMNSTTNRVENVNQKLKSVISKHSGMVTFFSDLVVIIRVLENEHRHRAICVFQKSSTSLMSSSQEEYAALVTPFAMTHINVQLLAAEKSDLIQQETTSISCNCGFATSMGLPCKHILKFRLNSGESLFKECLVLKRWRLDFFQMSQNLTQSTEYLQSNFISVSSIQQDCREPLSQQAKYRKAFLISQRIAALVSEAQAKQFDILLSKLLEFENSLQVFPHKEVNDMVLDIGEADDFQNPIVSSDELISNFLV